MGFNMGNQSSRGVSSAQYESESVIQFAPTAKTAATNKGDELDSAGRSILGLLHKAAGVAEANSQHALELAQKLSHELRTAEDRIAPSNGSTRSSPRFRSDFSGSSGKISPDARLMDVTVAELKSSLS